MSQKIIGPDLRDLHSFRELPIGATITGTGAVTVPTGTWRFYRPQLRDAIAPCQADCPAGVDVRAFLALTKLKKFDEAYRTYMEENPFPGLCGGACDRPCETACFRGLYDEPVAIRNLERFLASHGSSFAGIPIPENESNKDIAVVGNRLEELSCVYFLTRLGNKVAFFPGKKGVDGAIENLASAHGLPQSGPWKTEIKRILESNSLETIEGDFPSDHPDPFNAVIWGLKEEPTMAHPDLFRVSDHESSVARAIGKGKQAAIAVDLFFKKNDPETRHPALALGSHGFPSFTRYLTLISDGELKSPESVSFEELNERSWEHRPRGGSGEIGDAVGEARRCLECGKCTLCGQCVAFCPDQAVRPARGQKRVVFDYDYCKGCGICAYECPRGAICFVKEETGWR